MKSTKDEIMEEYYNFLVTAGSEDSIEASDKDIVPLESSTESGESEWNPQKSPSEMSPEEFNKLLEDIGGPQQKSPSEMSPEEFDKYLREPQTQKPTSPEPPKPASEQEEPSEELTEAQIEDFLRQTNPDITEDELAALMEEPSKEPEDVEESEGEYLKMIEEEPFDVLDSGLHKEPPYNQPKYIHQLIKSVFNKLDTMGGTEHMPVIWQYKVRQEIEYMLDILEKATEKRS